MAFSIIIPTYSAASELRLCLRSLLQNSSAPHELLVLVDPKNGAPDPAILNVLGEFPSVHRVLNEKVHGPYGSWNKGARLAQNKILCFLTDDQYFPPGWDKDLLTHAQSHPDGIFTSQLVESGACEPYHTNLCHDFGFHADEFDEAGFIDFVEKHKENRLAIDGFYIPTVIHKELFQKLNEWPKKKPFPHPNDRIFRQKLHRAGLEYQRVLTSFAYHFQAGSHREDYPEKRLWFDYMETWWKPAPKTTWSQFKHRLKGKIIWELKRIGALPKKKRVSGWAQMKKADMRLAYKYCVGRGIEIGPGSNRFPNVQTLSIDMVSEFHDRVYPPPDVNGGAYDLPFLPDNSRDFLLNSHVMEHLLDPIRALKEWCRVLKVGGHFLFVVPDKSTISRVNDNLAPLTSVSELVTRNRLGIQETIDADPRTSCRGSRFTACFDPSGEPGLRHYNFWTAKEMAEFLRFLRLEVVDVLEPKDKNGHTDRYAFDYDDFTVIARVTPESKQKSLIGTY